MRGTVNPMPLGFAVFGSPDLAALWMHQKNIYVLKVFDKNTLFGIVVAKAKLDLGFAVFGSPAIAEK